MSQHPDPLLLSLDAEIGALSGALAEGKRPGDVVLDYALRLGTARGALRVIRDLARERIPRSHGHPGAWADVLRAANVGLGEEGGG